MRAVGTCDALRSISTLDEANIRAAVQTFGFHSIQPTLEIALEREQSNSTRLRFIDELENWAKDDIAQGLAHEVKDWPAQQREAALNSLKKPQGDEYKFLLSIALRYDGLLFLEARLLPQIKSTAGCTFLLEFATHLHDQTDFADSDNRSRILKDLISSAIAKIDFYAPHKPKEPAWSHHSTSSESTHHLIRAQRFLKTCFKTGRDDLIGAVVEKLTDMKGQSRAVAQTRAKEVLLPLVTSLADNFRSVPATETIPSLRKLCNVAVNLYLESLSENPSSATKTDISSVMQVLILARQSELIISTVVPHVEAMSLDAHGLRAFLKSSTRSVRISKVRTQGSAI